MNDNFLIMFIFLELSMIIFICIMHRGKYSCYCSIKYFLVQTISSILFISSFLLFYLNSYILLFSMLIKIGVWPFHIWFINICLVISWINLFYILSFQKFFPIYIIFCFYSFNSLSFIFLIIIMLNCLVGFLNCFYIIDIRGFFGYTGIVDQSWLICGFIFSDFTGYLYIFIYIIFRFLIFFNFDKYRVKYLSFINFNFSSNCIFILNFISLIRIPPSFGFFLKFIFIYIFIYNGLYFFSFLFIFIKIIRIFFFSRCIILLVNNYSTDFTRNSFSEFLSYIFFNFLLNIFGVFILFFLI